MVSGASAIESLTDLQTNCLLYMVFRIVGPSPPGQKYKWLSCALGGTQGQSQYNYNATTMGHTWLDLGYQGTAFMRDVNGDGRDDYCK